MYTEADKPIVATGIDIRMLNNEHIIKHECGTIHYGVKFNPLKTNDDSLNAFSVRFTCEDAVVVTMRKKEVLHIDHRKLLGFYNIDVVYFSNGKYVHWTMNQREYEDFSEHLEFLPDFQPLQDAAFCKRKLSGKKYILKSMKYILEYYRYTKKYAYKTLIEKLIDTPDYRFSSSL